MHISAHGLSCETPAAPPDWLTRSLGHRLAHRGCCNHWPTSTKCSEHFRDSAFSHGFHTTARELQTCTIQGPDVSNTTKIPRKDPKRQKEKRKLWREKGKKKARNFGPPPFWAPPFWAPHFFSVWASTLRGSTLRAPHFVVKIQHPKKAEVEIGRSRSRSFWSEKKWYSSLECKQPGEWDIVAELMMLKFGENT